MAAQAEYLHLVENIVCLILRRLWHRKQHLSDRGLHEQLLKHRVHVTSSSSILETHKGVQRGPVPKQSQWLDTTIQGKLNVNFELQQLWPRHNNMACHQNLMLVTSPAPPLPPLKQFCC